MSAFDVSVYENAVIEGANETKYIPIPDGWYQGLCDQVRVKVVKTKDGEKPVLEVMHQATNASDELKKLLNRDKVTVRQDMWLDVTEQGAIAMGPNQNINLGKMREAVGLNDPRKKFSFKMLEGSGPYWFYVKGNTNADTGESFSNVTKIQKDRPTAVAA